MHDSDPSGDLYGDVYPSDIDGIQNIFVAATEMTRFLSNDKLVSFISSKFDNLGLNTHSLEHRKEEKYNENHSKGLANKYKSPELLGIMINESKLAGRTDEPQECEDADAEPPNLVLEFEINGTQKKVMKTLLSEQQQCRHNIQMTRHQTLNLLKGRSHQVAKHRSNANYTKLDLGREIEST
ncbi:hypothetical protein N7486_009800 [Penicillium sp. IBT 16267x]|nr:hypothetical protein N7486_009800 [Penicillium sp. IBT 16267x]